MLGPCWMWWDGDSDGVVPPDGDTLEWTTLQQRHHWTTDEQRLHYTTFEQRLHYEAPGDA